MNCNLYPQVDQVGPFQLRTWKMAILLSWVAGSILRVAKASCLLTENEVTGWKPIIPFVGDRLGRTGTTVRMRLKLNLEKGDHR